MTGRSDPQQYRECTAMYLFGIEFKWDISWRKTGYSHYSPRTFESDPFSDAVGNQTWHLEVRLTEYVEISLCLDTKTTGKIYADFNFSMWSSNSSAKKDYPGDCLLFCNKNNKSPYYRLGLLATIPDPNISIAMNLKNPVSEDIVAYRDFVPSRWAVKAANDFASLFESSAFSDLVLLVSGEEIKCHKNILSCRSSYFASMFKSGMNESSENVIKIKDFEADTMKDLIAFLYTSRIPTLTTDSALQLMRAADKYHVPDLKEYCEQFLNIAIGTSNAMEILLYADICCAENLKQRVINFICQNLPAFESHNYDALVERPELLKELLIAEALLRKDTMCYAK